VGSVSNRLTEPLRRAPATLPALVAIALFVVWATSQGGYPLTHWAPGGLVVLALLTITTVALRARLAELPLAVKLALASFAAYTAFSYLSILWAGVPGDAWEGANRTLLYVLVFALFATWRQYGTSAALLLCVWTLSLIGLALFVLLHVDAASGAGLQVLFPGARLTYPSSYANANAAQWLMAFWPALLLVRTRELHWSLRGLLAGGAVLLAEVALLSQSRGSLYATPVVLVLVFVLLPQRTRTFAVLIPIAAGIAAAARPVLHVGNDLNKHEEVVHATLHSAVTATLLASVAVALVVAVAAAIESRVKLSTATQTRTRRAVGAIAIAALVAVLAGGWAAAGDPIARVRHGWDTFKGGYAANSSGGDRLTSGLGSNRYDFYRVALDEFKAHPLVGIGADNFQQAYLVKGHSEETPRYPHSVELRVLTQTGLVGALLALLGLGAALVAVARAGLLRRARRADPLGASVAVAALAGFGYWLVHGSFDWFWEFAGLGAPAFALLGLACALAPARAAALAGEREIGSGAPGTDVGSAAPDADRGAPDAGAASARRGTRASSARTLLVRRLAIGVGIVALLAAAASFVMPWLGELQLEHAAQIWTKAPRQAYAALDDSASLNPLSDEAYLEAGSIALRFEDLARAERQFSLALGRVPGDAYATLELGAISSSRGDRAAALRLFERTVRLDPRDQLARAALAAVRSGKKVGVDELNRAILVKGQQLGG
jgi:tetratricopeptide (TPR) repeat protein